MITPRTITVRVAQACGKLKRVRDLLEWRNWQTHGTQKPNESGTQRETPTTHRLSRLRQPAVAPVTLRTITRTITQSDDSVSPVFRAAKTETDLRLITPLAERVATGSSSEQF
jgi:hypothetical protein